MNAVQDHGHFVEQPVYITYTSRDHPSFVLQVLVAADSGESARRRIRKAEPLVDNASDVRELPQIRVLESAAFGFLGITKLVS